MKADETSVKFEGLELYYYEDLEKDPNCPFHGAQTFHEHRREKKEKDHKNYVG